MKVEVAMKQRIQHAAATIVHRDGLTGLTMRAIAKEVGITAGAIYNHYADRDAILAEIWQDSSAKLARAFNEPIIDQDPNERILILTDRYVRWALAEPEIFDLMFRPGAPGTPLSFRSSNSEVTVADHAALNILVDAVRMCIESGAWRKDDVHDAALAVWANTHGLLSLYRSGRVNVSEANIPALARRSMQRLIAGLSAR